MKNPSTTQHSIHSAPPTGRILVKLISTSLWGFFEALTLNVVHFIDRHLWADFHTRFMRLIHNKFGGIVTPFDVSLEINSLKRDWRNRTPYTSYRSINGQEYLEKGHLTILPTQEIFNLLIRSNMNPSVSICYCRDQMKKHGHQCGLNAPLRTCLTLRLPQSVSSIRSSSPRLNEEQQKALYKLLMNCEQIGLVHQVVFYEKYNSYVVCNCCFDCCEILAPLFHSIREIKYHQKKLDRIKLLKEKEHLNRLTIQEKIEYKKLRNARNYHSKGARLTPTPLVAQSAFITVQNVVGKCINCGKCVKYCYFGARIMKEGKLHYNSNLCYGCGLCVSRCANSVIQLKKRSKAKVMSPLGIGIKHNHSHYP